MTKYKKIADEWDNLSEEFNTYKKNMYTGAAENISTTWPVFLKIIKKSIKKKSNLKILDYGCGVGMFCKKLNSLGLDAIGMDTSPKMITIAKKKFKNGTFFLSDHRKVPTLSRKYGKFDLITSIMVFQFVPNIKECIKNLSKSLIKNGYIIFAIHNPKKLDERKVKNKLEVRDTGKIVSIYKRTVTNYNKIFRRFKFKKVIEKYKNPNNNFLKKNKSKDSIKIPKYLILGYQKTN